MGKYFGTDGVRGIANIRLTSRLGYRIGRFLGQYPNGRKNKILIGRDTRLSGTMLDAALVSGITSSGGDVYELGITTTPSISYIVEHNDFDYGIMISASHNPFFDNGIKIFAPNGEKIPHELELLIEEYIDRIVDDLPLVPNTGLGRFNKADQYIESYLDYLAKQATADLSSFKVCFDLANGSASVLARELFSKRLGIKATYLNENYNGLNINDKCGSTHPEKLIQKMKKEHFDIGFAFDGDADRIMVVDSHGNLINGDGILYLAGKYLKKRNKLNDNKIVITVMSNFGLKKVLESEDIGYEEVDVGDKNVQACLKNNGLSLGGEQSGHIIFNDALNTGDGMMTAVKILSILAEEKQEIQDLLKNFVSYPQVLRNVGVSNKDMIMENEGFKAFLKEQEDLLDGDGRILVRPSGTEQLIRVMVEGKDLQKCKEIALSLCEYVNEIAY